MIPQKPGQIVKFHTTLEGENSEQQYVVLEIHDDSDNPRVKIQALNTNLAFAPINIVKLNEIEVAEVGTEDLIGHIVYIVKSDNAKILGKVVSVNTKTINLDLVKETNGIQTNVVLTIVDKDGHEHSGLLFVN